MTAELAVFWHPAVVEHDTGSGLWESAPSDLLAAQELHPENAERVENMRAVLTRGPIADRLRWSDGRLAEIEELESVHDPSYVAGIRDACEAGGVRMATTVVSPACADGYCLFNHAALAAERFRAAGAERMAIVDWDVHHGNGTQACFYDRSDVLTISIHMRHGSWGPTHPETGGPEETGIGAGEGHNVNVELRLGSGDGAYAEAFRRVVEPVLERYRPEVLIGACGQDASTFDGNGRMSLSMDGFHMIGERVRERAARAGAPLVLVQEGGYARTYAAYCLHATLEGVLGTGRLLEDPVAYLPDDPAHASADIDEVCRHHGERWGLR